MVLWELFSTLLMNPSTKLSPSKILFSTGLLCWHTLLIHWQACKRTTELMLQEGNANRMYLSIDVSAIYFLWKRLNKHKMMFSPLIDQFSPQGVPESEDLRKLSKKQMNFDGNQRAVGWMYIHLTTLPSAFYVTGFLLNLCEGPSISFAYSWCSFSKL